MWQLRSQQSFALHSWNDEYVAYDCATGDTHQLSWLAADVLNQLQQHPVTHGALVQEFLASDPTLDPQAVVTEVASVLAQFHQLALIEQVPA